MLKVPTSEIGRVVSRIRRANHPLGGLVLPETPFGSLPPGDRKRSISQPVVPRQDLPCQDHGGLGQVRSRRRVEPLPRPEPFLVRRLDTRRVAHPGRRSVRSEPVKLRITSGARMLAAASAAAYYPLVAHTEDLKPACIDETDTRLQGPEGRRERLHNLCGLPAFTCTQVGSLAGWLAGWPGGGGQPGPAEYGDGGGRRDRDTHHSRARRVSDRFRRAWLRSIL